MGLPGDLRGVCKRVKGVVAPGVAAAGVAVGAWGFLAEMSFRIVQRRGGYCDHKECHIVLLAWWP